MEVFQEELANDRKEAWFGYINKFSMNCYFIFKHIAKGQRGVRCRKCKAKIPKEVPRVLVSGSWYYWTGHYCLRCALKTIAEDIASKGDLVKFLNENLENLSSLHSLLSRTVEKEKYKNLMAIGVLASRIEPKRER